MHGVLRIIGSNAKLYSEGDYNDKWTQYIAKLALYQHHTHGMLLFSGACCQDLSFILQLHLRCMLMYLLSTNSRAFPASVQQGEALKTYDVVLKQITHATPTGNIPEALGQGHLAIRDKSSMVPNGVRYRKVPMQAKKSINTLPVENFHYIRTGVAVSINVFLSKYHISSIRC